MQHDSISLDWQTSSAAHATSAEAFRLVIDPFGARALRVLRVRGREALSRPYLWDVSFTATDPGFGPSAALGRPARLTIGPLAEAPREVLGLVAGITSCGGREHGHPTYRARIVPRLAMLRHRRTSRVFEERNVPAIVGAVLDLAGIPHRWETRARYAQRAYCVQYDETDLAFVTRLCAEVGIWFRFDPPDPPDQRGAAEIVTFGDSEEAPDLEGGARLVCGRPALSALRGDEACVTAFEIRRAVTPSAITVRGYDFRRPSAPLEARAVLAASGAGDGEPAGEMDEHHDRNEDAKDAESGLAGAFLAQLARNAHTAHGESLCPRLAPGRRFALQGHDSAPGDGMHVVTAVRHEGRAPRIAGEQPIYENRFSCVPATCVPRPRRPRRKVRAVTETAIVVAPAGRDIHVDTYGRIRVRFHWQRDAGGEHCACWARVATPWAGASWGTQFLPRVGMEVVVSFIAGDASRPMVVGCVPNATHPGPFAPPRDTAISGIRTQTTPGGDGYNEIAFADAKGAELLSLRAERDFARCVRQDLMTATSRDEKAGIGRDRATTVARHDVLRVGERLSIEVAGTARQEMSGDTIAHATGGGAGVLLAGKDARLKTAGSISLDAGGDITIGAAGNVTIKAGGAITIEASGAVALLGATLDAGARGAIVIQGATVDLNP